MVTINRFDIYLISLDPRQGSEINKTRPCVVISPDELHSYIRTVIIAPMTTKGREYPTRVSVEFLGKSGQIVLDQIRTVDKTRLLKKMGNVTEATSYKIIQILQKMFAL